MSQVGVDPTINQWDEPLPLGVVDPHDSLSHPAGVSDAQAETAALLDPDQFTNFLVSLNNLLSCLRCFISVQHLIIVLSFQLRAPFFLFASLLSIL